jgi:hypothetical protein
MDSRDHYAGLSAGKSARSFIMFRTTFPLWVGLIASLGSVSWAREWTDATGRYTVEADLIGFDSMTAVLKKEDGKMVALPIERLSEADQKYLQTKEAEDLSKRSAEKTQTWTLRGDFKVVGRVVSYGRKELVVQRRRGRVYVNDRVFDNLPEVYQKMVPKIVAHHEKIEFADEKDFLEWVRKQRGKPFECMCEGVMLELENGDEYGIPFFFFSDDDLAVLKPGWEQWLAAEKDAQEQAHHDMMVRSMAEQYQRDKAVDRQIALLQLQLLAVDAGVTDLWEVHLAPAFGVPVWVVVPGRNSEVAAAQALRMYPGYSITGIAKVR